MIDEKYLTEHTSVLVCAADGTVRFAHNENRVRKSASLIKLFIAEAALRSGLPLSGRLEVPKKAYLGNSILTELKQPEVTLYEALAAMLACSDNTATNLLIAYLGGFEALNAAFRSFGAVQTARSTAKCSISRRPRRGGTTRPLPLTALPVCAGSVPTRKRGSFSRCRRIVSG